MTATAILDNLTARGVRVWAEADRLKVDAPTGVLTEEVLADLRLRKSEILDALASRPAPCPRCDGALRLQDRQADAWYCPRCRKWCDGQGDSLPVIETVRPVTLEEVEARQLIADLLAAGCGFFSDDGEHVRVTNYGSLPTALWLRFEQATPEFARLALEAAREHEGEEKPKWVT